MTRSSQLCALLILVGLALTIDSTVAKRKNWVLLVAGSKGWGDYSVQSNMYHAYQVAHANGIPDEQIVVMSYDDIAYHERNPWPGVLINKPDGPNVNKGVPKDYTGDEVNGDVFYAVLRGDKEAVKELTGRDGKVIESGPEDHVFVTYSDHGGVGTVVMPAKPNRLYADELNEAIKSLHAEKKYRKFVFYLESCMSGSMFDGLLPNDINAYAMTASRPDQCAAMAYFVKELGTCVGGEFSCNWMENCDENDINTETLQEQFEAVRDKTEYSDVMQYGDLSFTSLTVSEFLGSSGKTARINSTRSKMAHPACSMSSDERPIFVLEQLLAGPMGRKHGKELKQSIEEHRWLRAETQNIMEDVARIGKPGQDTAWAFNTQVKINDWDCYRHAIDGLIELCPRLEPSANDYAVKRLHVMANMCNSLPEAAVMEAVKKAAIGSSLCDL